MPCEGDPTPTPVPPARPTRTPAPRATATPGGALGTCANFVTVWPTYDAAYYNQEFTWTAVEGATRYSLDIYSNMRAYLTTFFYGNTTRVYADVGDLLHGGSIYWRVNVLDDNGNIICSTPLSNEITMRPKPTPPNVLSARWQCSANGVIVEWSGANPSPNVFLTYAVVNGEFKDFYETRIGSASSGSYAIYLFGTYEDGILSDGSSRVSLPNITCDDD